MNKQQLKNDPFVEKWRANYTKNLRFEFEKDHRIGIIQANKIAVNSKIASPTYLVNPGPSLDKNISSLKKIADKKTSTIICSDVCLFKLIDNGIIPDMVCTLDPSETISNFWHGYAEYTKEIILVAATCVSNKSLSFWRGPVIFFNQADPYEWRNSFFTHLTKKTSVFGSFMNMFFVGATLLQTSQIINSLQIFLVGYDFANSQDKIPYCSGFMGRRVTTHLKTKDDVHGDSVLQKNEYSDIKDLLLNGDWNSGISKFIDRMISDEVLKYSTIQVEMKSDPAVKLWTNANLMFYKKTFLSMLGQLQAAIYNCTEGGILSEIANIKLDDSQGMIFENSKLSKPIIRSLFRNYT